MRRLEFDQFEFSNPTTEERLVVTLEDRGRGPGADLPSFLRRCDGGAQLADRLAETRMTAFAQLSGARTVAEHLETFAGLSHDELQAATAARLPAGADEDLVVLETPRTFALYAWSTSA